MKAPVVERLKRTLKEHMWEAYSMNGNYKWVQLLPSLVKDYNNTVHSKTNIKPISVDSTKAKSLKTVHSNFKIAGKPKFEVNQRVRISKYKRMFSEGYTPNGTTKTLRKDGVQLINPVAYLLRASMGDRMAGDFYEYEPHVVHNPQIYSVEKILRKKAKNVFVKWLGVHFI